MIDVQMETLDFVFWVRQLIGFGVGLGAGLLHLTGMYVIIGFVAAMITLSNMYAYKVLNVAEEDFQNNELTMEGLANSFGIFMVRSPSTNLKRNPSLSPLLTMLLLFFLCVAYMDRLLLLLLSRGRNRELTQVRVSR